MTTNQEATAIRAEIDDIDETLRRLVYEAGPSTPDAAEDLADAAAELTGQMEREAQIEGLQRRREKLLDQLAES